MRVCEVTPTETDIIEEDLTRFPLRLGPSPLTFVYFVVQFVGHRTPRNSNHERRTKSRVPLPRREGKRVLSFAFTPPPKRRRAAVVTVK